MSTLTVPAEGGERLAVQRVGMTSSIEVGSSGVDGVVDGKSSLVVDHSLGTTTVDDVAIRADEQQVRDGHEAEGNTERVDPEVILENGVSESQMASDAFFETKQTKDSEGLCEPLLASASLVLERVVGNGLNETRQAKSNLHQRCFVAIDGRGKASAGSLTRMKLTLGNLNLGAPFCTSLAAGCDAGTLSVAVGGDMVNRPDIPRYSKGTRFRRSQ